jgi:hypothetical protein
MVPRGFRTEMFEAAEKVASFGKSPSWTSPIIPAVQGTLATSPGCPT